MKTLKNIVVVNDFDYVQGGASKVAIQTANMLKENDSKLNVYFFSAAHNDSSILNKEVINICTNQGEALKDKNKIRGIINGLYNFKVKREFKKLLKNLNRDETIIHVHGWTKCLSSSVFDIAFKMKYKVVLTMHDYFTACPNGGYFNFKKNEICHFKPISSKCIKCNCDSRNYAFKLYRIVRQFIQNKVVGLNRKLEDVISVSNFSEKILKKTLNPKTRIHRVYNPIDLDKNPKVVDYRKNKYYLYVGSVLQGKGVDIFCKAISELGLKGIVVGDGPELVKLKKDYPSIEYTGWKKPSEVKEYMQGAKALVVPSRWYECAPLTPLEALQYGIPIITSDCNATVDYIDDSNGIIFSIKSNNLKDLLINFSNKFNPKIIIYSNYVEDLMKLYKELMEEI